MPANKQNVPRAGVSPRVEEIRARRRIRRIRALAVIALAAALITAYFLGAFGAPLALMGDLVETAQIYMTAGDGFPLTWDLQGYTAARPMSGSFVALGSTEAMVYAQSGAVLRRIPHSYSRPCISVGNTRFCMYNRGGTELVVESRTRHLYDLKLDEAISLAELSKNGTLAVFSATKLSVYSPLFENIWTWSGISETPFAMAFSPNSKQLATACMTLEGGALGTTLRLFSINSSNDPLTITVPDGVAVNMQYFGSNRLLVVYDTFAALYDTATGQQQARYNFDSRLLRGVSISENAVALLFGAREYPDVTSLSVLNARLEKTASVQIGAGAHSVTLCGDAVYLLADNTLLAYQTADGAAIGAWEMETRLYDVVAMREPLLLLRNEIRPAKLPEQTVSAAQEQAAQANSAGEPAESTPAESTPEEESLPISA